MKDQYTVTVRREPEFAVTGTDSWVARDPQGTWRAYCAARFAGTAAAAVGQIFHANEIASVDDLGDTARAVILAN